MYLGYAAVKVRKRLYVTWPAPARCWRAAGGGARTGSRGAPGRPPRRPRAARPPSSAPWTRRRRRSSSGARCSAARWLPGTHPRWRGAGLVGIGRHAEGAGDPAPAQGAQEGEPAGVALGVDGAEAEQTPVAVGSGFDRRDQRAGGDVAAGAAFDVGGVDPDAAEESDGQVSLLQVGHGVVQRLAYPRRLGGAHAIDAQGRHHVPRLPRGHAARRHLGRCRHHRSVNPRVALDRILREVAAAPELGDARVYGAHAGDG